MPALSTQVAQPALLAGCLVMVLLAVWLPVTVARRWVPPRWRAVTASAGSALVLALGLGLAVASFSALAR